MLRCIPYSITIGYDVCSINVGIFIFLTIQENEPGFSPADGRCVYWKRSQSVDAYIPYWYLRLIYKTSVWNPSDGFVFDMLASFGVREILSNFYDLDFCFKYPSAAKSLKCRVVILISFSYYLLPWFSSAEHPQVTDPRQEADL